MSPENRYSRHILLPEIGEEGQLKLSQAKVLVIGAGGLGCPALQYLTAAGIGTLGIIDFDTVEESNLQRQILFGTASLGKNKALAAKERLHDLNPLITINTYPYKLTVKNALTLFADYDIIVDGTDNFSTRYLVNDACLILKKPLIYGAIYKFEGQLAVFNYENGPSYRCLFPNPPKPGDVPSCDEIGVLGVLPGMIGAMQANEVLKIILGLGDILSEKLFIYNALTAQSTTISIRREEKEIDRILATDFDFEMMDYDFFCGINPDIKEISAEEAVKHRTIQFIDIREVHEQPKIEDVHPLYIPTSEIATSLDKIDQTKEIVLFCQSGIRSKKTALFLKQKGFHHCYSLKGGALALKQVVSLSIKNETHEK